MVICISVLMSILPGKHHLVIGPRPFCTGAINRTLAEVANQFLLAALRVRYDHEHNQLPFHDCTCASWCVIVGGSIAIKTLSFSSGLSASVLGQVCPLTRCMEPQSPFTLRGGHAHTFPARLGYIFIQVPGGHSVTSQKAWCQGNHPWCPLPWSRAFRYLYCFRCQAFVPGYQNVSRYRANTTCIFTLP